MRTLKCFSVFIVGMVTTLLCFGHYSRAEDKKKLTPVTVVLNYFPGPQHMAFSYGTVKGFYADEGIELNFISGKGSPLAIKTIAEDRARFAWGGSDAVMAAISNNDAPVELIGTYFVITQFGVIFRTDKDINSPRDLKGKKIAFLNLEAPRLLFPMFLQAIGLKDDDVTQVILSSPQEKDAYLKDGKVEAMGNGLSEFPTEQSRIKSVKLGFLLYSDVLPLPGDGLSVNTKYLKTKEDRDLNCRMIRATTRSFNAAIKDIDGAAASIVKVFKDAGSKDVEVEKNGIIRELSLITARQRLGHPLGFTYKEDWERSLKLMEKFHLIQKSKNLNDYFTNDYVKCAEDAS